MNCPILPEFEPIQVIYNFHTDSIKTKQALLWTRWNMGFFGTKGQVLLKSIVWSGWNTNLSKTLCLSRLSASLIKIQLKLNRLCSKQCQIWRFSALKGKLLHSEESDLAGHFLHYKCMGNKFYRSWVSNSEVNSLIRPKIKLVWDFMTVFITCKFDEDLIKIMSLSSGQHLVHIKFDLDWPTCLGDIQVWKCGQIDDRPYYKLNLWASGSG